MLPNTVGVYKLSVPLTLRIISDNLSERTRDGFCLPRIKSMYLDPYSFHRSKSRLHDLLSSLFSLRLTAVLPKDYYK